MRSPGYQIGLWYGAGALVLAAPAISLAPWGLLIAWPAMSLAIVSAGYLGFGPGVFGKRDGRLHPLARALLGPYLLPLSLWRVHRQEGNPDDHVASGVRLGRLITPRRARSLIAEGVTSVLDLTCEHAEVGPFLSIDYRNIQVLDLTPPGLDELSESVQFVLERMGNGDVYIHCAQGFGRSAIVAAACLLALDSALTVDEARRRVEQARPTVKLRSARVTQLLGEYRTRCRTEPSG
jgi:hypothetical protein